MDRKYRVMIIDDEQSARKLMRASIDWESLNMEVVGEAASGIEAINTIDEIRPDIAFVDISMPFMDGIEFTQVATGRYPNLVIIIMTAIDKFEYARKCVSLPEVLERVKGKLDNSPDFWDDNKASSEGTSSKADSTETIKAYVEENYGDPKLNLAFIAQHFGFSASYLSRKFKQDTGKNFIEYLTGIRMTKAMDIARSGHKMYQAAAEVGIPDPNYFGRCFKKYAGMSYSDYVNSEDYEGRIAVHKTGA